MKRRITEKGKTKKPLMLALAVCALSIVAMIIALTVPKEPVVGDFAPPEFDSNALLGTPDVPKELGYTEPYADGMTFRAGICGKPTVCEGKADVYFTNKSENDTWLMLRITDEHGEVLAQTGLLRPGEYLKTVSFDKIPESGKIVYKVMAYEPQTYYSRGYFKLSTVVNMQD